MYKDGSFASEQFQYANLFTFDEASAMVSSLGYELLDRREWEYMMKTHSIGYATIGSEEYWAAEDRDKPFDFDDGVDYSTGLVILPDSFTLPDGCSSFISVETGRVNSYDLTQWAAMEAAGAVFLPAQGALESSYSHALSCGVYIELDERLFCFRIEEKDYLSYDYPNWIYETHFSLRLVKYVD